MGTSRSAAQLAGKFSKAAGAVQKNNPKNVKRVADFAADTTKAMARPPTGGDLAFSGAGRASRKNRPIDVRVSDSGGSAFKVKAIGPMHWLESGVQPHPIIPGGNTKKARGLAGANLGDAAGPRLGAGQAGKFARGKSKGKLMIWGGGSAAAFYVQRGGGFKARHTWTEGIKAAEKVQGEIMWRGVSANMIEVFG